MGSPGIWDYAVPRGHLSPACSPVVPSRGDWALLMAPVGFPRFSQASQGHGTLPGPGGVGPGGCGSCTSCEGALHVVDDLVVVTDDVVTVDDDRYLLAQVEPHEPGLLVLTLRQAHVPLVTGQALLRDHQPHLQAPGSERGRRADTRGHSAQVGWSIWGREVRGHI